MTREELTKILTYDPIIGRFTWKERTADMFDNSIGYASRLCRTWNKRFANREAGTRGSSSYVKINYNGKIYFAHRLAWLYMTGVMPVEIDHIDRDPSNNRWINLRAATRELNNQNKGLNKNNKTGVKGVRKKRDKYEAKIMRNGIHVRLGLFDSAEEAAVAYINAAKMDPMEFSKRFAA